MSNHNYKGIVCAVEYEDYHLENLVPNKFDDGESIDFRLSIMLDGWFFVGHVDVENALNDVDLDYHEYRGELDEMVLYYVNGTPSGVSKFLTKAVDFMIKHIEYLEDDAHHDLYYRDGLNLIGQIAERFEQTDLLRPLIQRLMGYPCERCEHLRCDLVDTISNYIQIAL